MPRYPVELGYDRTLYERVNSILSEKGLASAISPSIMDKCHGNKRGLDFLSSDYEKALIKLMSYYDGVFPQNKEKPFSREHNYWVTNEQFVALFWECLKFYDDELVGKWYQGYLNEKKEQNLRNDDKTKLDQISKKNLFQVNYAELIKAGYKDNHKLAGFQGDIYKYAHRILRGLEQEGLIIREKEDSVSGRTSRTYLRINPGFITLS